MVDPKDPRTLCASVPQPRKNRRVIRGRFNILDFAVIVPALGIFVAVLLTSGWPFYGPIVFAIGEAAIVLLLVWPLSLLGKDKAYIWIARAIGYLFQKNRYGERAQRNEGPPEVEKQADGIEPMQEKDIAGRPDLISRIGGLLRGRRNG